MDTALIRAQGRALALLAVLLGRAGVVPAGEFAHLLGLSAVLAAESAPAEGDILAVWAAMGGAGGAPGRGAARRRVLSPFAPGSGTLGPRHKAEDDGARGRRSERPRAIFHVPFMFRYTPAHSGSAERETGQEGPRYTTRLGWRRV